MSSDAGAQLLDLLEEIGAIQGVRGALIASIDGAFAEGARSGLEAAVALDVAKTVRRMTVASATVGAPLEELLINFGAARMLVVPIREDGTLVVLLERDAAVESARSLLRVQLDEIQGLLEAIGGGRAPRSEAPEPSDEIARVLASELGPVLVSYSQPVSQTLKPGKDGARYRHVINPAGR